MPQSAEGATAGRRAQPVRLLWNLAEILYILGARGRLSWQVSPPGNNEESWRFA